LCCYFPTGLGGVDGIGWMLDGRRAEKGRKGGTGLDSFSAVCLLVGTGRKGKCALCVGQLNVGGILRVRFSRSPRVVTKEKKIII
jgi:hypothetical protein